MSLFRVGPEGLLLGQALIISALVAVFAWRRVSLAAGIPATAVVAVGLAILQAMSPDMNPDLRVKLVAASFVVVPSALLLGASRLEWLARRAWVLLVVGPIVFVGCYVGICELCVKARLI